MVDAGPHRDDPPGGHWSRWTINWTGLIALVLLASIAVIAWRWLDAAIGSPDELADPADELDVGSTRAPTGAGEELGPVTTPARASMSPTTVPSTPPTDPPATSTTVAPGPRVLISGEVKPCRFGSDCLVASFTIEGFQEHSGRFVCVYPNSRREFSFGDDGVDDACKSGDPGDTIAIEVDGVRSATISAQDLDGTGGAP